VSGTAPRRFRTQAARAFPQLATRPEPRLRRWPRPNLDAAHPDPTWTPLTPTQPGRRSYWKNSSAAMWRRHCAPQMTSTRLQGQRERARESTREHSLTHTNDQARKPPSSSRPEQPTTSPTTRAQNSHTTSWDLTADGLSLDTVLPEQLAAPFAVPFACRCGPFEVSRPTNSREHERTRSREAQRFGGFRPYSPLFAIL
jgi:hypothetical protein